MARVWEVHFNGIERQSEDWDALVTEVVNYCLEDGAWADDEDPRVTALLYYDDEDDVGTDATYADLDKFDKEVQSQYKLDRADIIATLDHERR